MNPIRQFQVNRFLQKDQWLEARKRSRAPVWQRLLYWLFGLFAKTHPMGLLREGTACIVDLSSYNPKADIEGLIDAGITHFFLRMVYVKTFMRDHWDLTEDPCYRTFYDKIRAYAKLKGKTVRIAGYVIYCSGVEDYNFELATDYIQAIKTAMGGTAYRPDMLWIDDEVNKWIENNRTVTATPINQIRGVQQLVRKCWKTFGLVTGWYGARWFVNQVAGGGSYLEQYTTWFDSVNKPESLGGPGQTVPQWFAWYPLTLSEVFKTFADFAAKIYTPSGQQEANLLACGQYYKWDAWQCTSSWMTPYNFDANGKPAGLDASISRLPLAQFDALFNLTSTPPPLPPPPPPQGFDWEKLRADGHAQWEAFIDAEKAKV